ncbi:diacylglycerol/lipid kinase family protein [Flavobacterium maritimum]|uniref:diacylglycerol/lipid kinase family protein n=1 Tax=Flavobacterium maritimum TaxID=3149042 RepID=UPI0032B5CBCD
MKKNVLMVVNPVSGGIDKLEFIDAARLFAAKENLNFILYTTTGNDDFSKIKELYFLYRPERIIIAGGDGTIKMVAEAMERQDVILGILPAGSANGLAVELNLMKTLEENINIAFHNEAVEMDMVVINGKKSMHLSDLGLNAELVKNYELSEVRGMWGYALQAVTTLIDLEEPFTATIEANNQTLVCMARMIVIANSKKYGTGVVINPDGVVNDGKFELVILKNLDLVVFIKIITGNIPMNIEDVEIISTDKATITTNFPVSFQIDGEYCGQQTRLDIEILPKQMKIAVP